MVQSKKLIPEVYSQSYDMSIFTAVIDLVYTARELDVLRAKNSHLPTKCFEEDVSRLSSLFGLGDLATRELLAEYRLLVKQKGSTDVISSIAQFACSKDATQDGAKIRIIDDFFYDNGKKVTIIRQTSKTTATEESEYKITKLDKIVQTTSYERYITAQQPATNDLAKTNELVRKINAANAPEVQNDDGTVTMSVEENGVLRSIRADSTGVPQDIGDTVLSVVTIVDGKYDKEKTQTETVSLPEEPYERQVTTIEVYVDFTELKSELLELLVRRLAPVGTHIVVKHIAEYRSLTE